jgi:hypothetical protein
MESQAPLEISQSPPLLRPRPRRPFEISSSPVNSPLLDQQQSLTPPANEYDASAIDLAEAARSRSILNLTSSTLFGIYAPTPLGADATDTPPTPWGTGAETPARHGSVDDGFGDFSRTSSSGRDRGVGLGALRAAVEETLQKQQHQQQQQQRRPGGPLGSASDSSERTLAAPKASPARHAMRLAVLFVFGVAYGALVAHLQDSRRLAVPMVQGSEAAVYIASWGIAGVTMGSLLPWVDRVTRSRTASALHAVEWNDVVRSIGAFVGVAFAIVSCKLRDISRRKKN